MYQSTGLGGSLKPRTWLLIAPGIHWGCLILAGLEYAIYFFLTGHAALIDRLFKFRPYPRSIKLCWLWFDTMKTGRSLLLKIATATYGNRILVFWEVKTSLYQLLVVSGKSSKLFLSSIKALHPWTQITLKIWENKYVFFTYKNQNEEITY